MVAQRFTTCPTSCLSPRPRRQRWDCCVLRLTHVLTWRSAAAASKENLPNKYTVENLQARSNRCVYWGEALDDNLETIKHRSHRMKLGFPACLTTGCKSKLLLRLNKHDASPMICWRQNGDFAAEQLCGTRNSAVCVTQYRTQLVCRAEHTCCLDQKKPTII